MKLEVVKFHVTVRATEGADLRMFALGLRVLAVNDFFEILKLKHHVVTVIFWMRSWSKVFAARGEEKVMRRYRDRRRSPCILWSYRHVPWS